MIRRITFLLCLLLATGVSAVWAQQHSVSGSITDAETGEYLIGVNVVVEGTDNGTATNNNGAYRLTGVPQNGVLVITYIGYQTQRIPVNGRTEINISLELSAEVLDELVVTALGVTRDRRSLGYSVGQRSEEHTSEL